MLCNRFKETKPLDLERGIKTYIAKHYGIYLYKITLLLYIKNN